MNSRSVSTSFRGAIIWVMEPLVVVTSRFTKGVVGSGYGVVKPLAIWVIGAHVGGVGAVECEVAVVCTPG